MTIEVTLAEVAVASAFLGGQIAMLATTIRSNRSQGQRLGSLEKWREAVIAVEKERRRRKADTRGIPIIDGDDTPT